MAGFDKVVSTYEEAMEGLTDGMTVIAGGFGICGIPENLIKEIKIFDVYEGENIPSDKKSIALKVTIQSDHKTLNESDLTNISKKIISTVEEKTGAKLRS